MTSREQSLVETSIHRVANAQIEARRDVLAVEEPLEIRLHSSKTQSSTRFQPQSVSVTMRTPGHDFELAVGFLFSEGILHRREDVETIRHVGLPQGESRAHNIVQIELSENVELDLSRLERHFFTSSSCGVCGKTSIRNVQQTLDEIEYSKGETRDFKVAAAVLHALPHTLRSAQNVFEQTGGLHAAALFDVRGNLLLLREDVGRHNALDKLIGARFLENSLPLQDEIVLLSGRVSFELVQKAVVAGVVVLVAVGAPSSLAVDVARRFDITLLGFLRNGRFNIYSGAGRIRA